jgi:hypothetical protein
MHNWLLIIKLEVSEIFWSIRSESLAKLLGSSLNQTTFFRSFSLPVLMIYRATEPVIKKFLIFI